MSTEISKTFKRFYTKIRFKKKTGCWLWTASVDKNGYGYFYFDGRRNGKAHHFVMKYLKGIDRTGKTVCHTCDNPTCVNPEHLYLGTPQTNMKDRVERGHYRSVSGDNSCFAKLKESDVMTILKKFATGTSISEMATEYDLTYQGIYLIVKRKNWKHVKNNQTTN